MAWATLPQYGYHYIKTEIRPHEGDQWRLLEENAMRYLRFERERKQLKRQLLTGCNDLTKALPTELVELIWAEMFRVLRVHLLKPL